jgi:quinoprotein glucose dehydrogenase
VAETAVPAAVGREVKVTKFAPDSVCGQVLALSVDDAGQVFAAVTARSFGRGTVMLGDDAALLAEDRNLRTVADRVTAAKAWLGADRLKARLAERQLFFNQSGDGPANFLTKFSESVRRLEDHDANGEADHTVTIADNFRDPADGSGGALLALPDGKWLFGCPPRLWRLEKPDAASTAQARRNAVAEGFGLRNGDSAAGLHALLEAPDGWIYFAMGDRGYDLRQANGQRVRGLGSGAIFRCRADGSELERFASGLKNPTGLAMDAEGRLFAMDQAVPGGQARLLLVIPGADFGWQAELVTAPGQGVWFSEGMEAAGLAASGAPGAAEAGSAGSDRSVGSTRPLWCLPPLALLPDLEASTLEILPTAGSKENASARPLRLVAADARPEGKGGLVSLRLESSGTAFRLAETGELWRGGAVLATATAPDGGIVFADWGTQPGPFSSCSIRRLEFPSAAPGATVAASTSAAPASTLPKVQAAGSAAADSPAAASASASVSASAAASAPGGPSSVAGLIASIPGLPVKKLRALLEHPSPRVRLRAARRMAEMPFQEAMEPLLAVAARSKNLAARYQALRAAGWLSQGDSALLGEVARFLTDPEPSVRATAATVLGEGKLRTTPSGLLAALTDSALTVRLAAAAALGRLHTPGAADDLLAAAARNDSGDPFVRSSLAAALANVCPAEELAEAGTASLSAEVRLTVVHALRRLAAAELSGFLTDADPMVATEAARAVYDLPVFPALPALALRAEPDKSPRLPGALTRRALAAALRGGLADAPARIADFALAADTPADLRQAALETLAAWDQPPADDPLCHRPFYAMPRLPGLARAALRRAASGLTSRPEPELAAAAKAFLATPQAAELSTGALLTLVQKADATPEARLSALRSLIARNALPSDTARTLTLAAESASTPPAVRAEARSLLMQRDPKNAPLLASEAFNAGTALEKQAVIHTLDHLPGTANDNERLLLDAARRLSQGTIEPAIQVEVLEALQRRDIESRSPWRRATDAWLASLSLTTDALSPWRMTLTDGDPAAGRLVFETHPDARCTDCHALHGQGGITGPDLENLADRLTTPGTILESLIHPAARTTSAPPGSIVTMPPMGTLLTRRELRDLMAFLTGLKAG